MRWYADHQGVSLPPQSYDTPPWQQEAGYVVFAPFPIDSDMFGDAEKQWMINFRVADLDAMVRQLRDNGVDVTVYEETYPKGRLAQLVDPEGNPIQWWEPSEPKAD